jgi:hypothetical protein
LAHVQEVEVTSRGAAGMALGHSISMPAQGHTAGGGAAGGPVGSRRLEKNVTIGEGPGATSQVSKRLHAQATRSVYSCFVIVISSTHPACWRSRAPIGLPSSAPGCMHAALQSESLCVHGGGGPRYTHG